MKLELNTGVNAQNLKEHDAVFMRNPLKEDFSWRFNGEEYTIGGGETKSFSKFVTFHLSKHLSTQMIIEDVSKQMTEKVKNNIKDPKNAKVAQLQIYDTTERRIALYRILGNVELVQEVIKAYPFKGFIGDMNEYKRFVEKSQKEDIKS